jgi:hypothetical protein
MASGPLTGVDPPGRSIWRLVVDAGSDGIEGETIGGTRTHRAPSRPAF